MIEGSHSRTAEPNHTRAQAEVAKVGIQVGQPSILITTHLWIQWAHVAIENYKRASSHRRSHAVCGSIQSEKLLGETADSMVAICASVFAIEAFTSSAARVVMPASTVSKWEDAGGRAKRADGRLREVLKASINHARIAEEAASKWTEHFRQRNTAVHFMESPKAPAPHPVGTNTSPEDGLYRLENARASVDLLLETMTNIENHPKPAIREWISDFSATLERLRDLRSA